MTDLHNDLKTDLALHVMERAEESVIAWGVKHRVNIRMANKGRLFFNFIVTPTERGPSRVFSVSLKENM